MIFPDEFVTPLTFVPIFVPSNLGTSCGDGVAARPVSCPSGTEADCAFTPRPLDRKSCRNITGGVGKHRCRDHGAVGGSFERPNCAVGSSLI